MQEITVETASPKLRDLFNKGFVAMERGNLGYAIDLFNNCITTEPRFLNARKFLRAAEIKVLKSRNPNAVTNLIVLITNLPALFLAKKQIKADPPQAIVAMEKLLRKDPLNVHFIQIFAEAAEVADMPEIAIQTLELTRDHHPDNVPLLNLLGRLYTKTAQTEKAKACFEHICELHPNDGAAFKALKDAEAIHSMSKDGWSEAAASGKGYRGLIKDEKEATILEKEAKAARTESDVEALIEENLAKIKKEPENINYRRALANLYAANKLFTEAIQCLEATRQLSTSGRDPQIDNAINAIKLQQFDFEIDRLRKAGSNIEADATERQRNDYAFADLQDRVSRYPNDLALRFELGVLLHGRKMITEAIQQFQLAQRNPSYRLRALYYIGLCFAAKKQYDMAAEQLEAAAGDIATMDDQKKAILYELGLVRDAMGKHKEALECFKTIYQVDISYKDISARIEKGYTTT